jgi:hypothetical protein
MARRTEAKALHARQGIKQNSIRIEKAALRAAHDAVESAPELIEARAEGWSREPGHVDDD